MDKGAKFSVRISREGDWFIAFSPEFPEGNGQGLSEEEALESLRQSIALLNDDAPAREQPGSKSGATSAWDHLSTFAGSVEDDFVIPERKIDYREIPDLE